MRRGPRSGLSSPCTSPYTPTSPLADGTHTFTVTDDHPGSTTTCKIDLDTPVA